MEKASAVIEIKNSCFKLLVGYLYDNKINVIYKNSYPLTNINNDGDIYNIESLSNDLKRIKIIEDDAKKIRIEISDAILLIPPFGLNVFSSTRTTNTTDKSSKIDKLDISNCLNMLKKSKLDNPNSEIIDIIPNSFTIDGNKSFSIPPLGQISNNITINAFLYTLPIRLINSFKSTLNKAQIKISRTVISPLGVNELLKLNHKLEDKYVLVDYSDDETTLSFFGNGKLYASKYFDIGGKNITKDIASKFEISFLKAKELKEVYGLNLRQTEFSSPILSVRSEDSITRKYNVNELSEVIENSLNEWNRFFSNCLNNLLSDYPDFIDNINLVFIGNSTKLNGFKEFISTHYPNNHFVIYENDSVGASEPGDVNLLGGIAFASKYKGSLEDSAKIEISNINRKKTYESEIDDEI